jgi:hypothetical protein
MPSRPRMVVRVTATTLSSPSLAARSINAPAQVHSRAPCSNAAPISTLSPRLDGPSMAAAQPTFSGSTRKGTNKSSQANNATRVTANASARDRSPTPPMAHARRRGISTTRWTFRLATPPTSYPSRTLSPMPSVLMGTHSLPFANNPSVRMASLMVPFVSATSDTLVRHVPSTSVPRRADLAIQQAAASAPTRLTGAHGVSTRRAQTEASGTRPSFDAIVLKRTTAPIAPSPPAAHSVRPTSPAAHATVL